MNGSPGAGWSAPHLGPERYRRWRASELGSITEQLEQALVLELIGDVGGREVLEIGCGDGTMAVRLAGQGARVVGLDASEAMLEAARDRAARSEADVTFCRGLAETLPFADDSFDLVVAVTILCFVAEADRTFAEIGRVLRPGGRLVIGELGRWSTWALGRRIRGWLGSTLWRQGRFRTAAELRKLAMSGGLESREIRGAIYYPRSTLAARALARFDAALGRRTTLGAAFLVMAATKPPR